VTFKVSAGAQVHSAASTAAASARRYDPMSIAVARDVYVAKDESDNKAALPRTADVRRRTNKISRAFTTSSATAIIM
jgi:hypothetical protein